MFAVAPPLAVTAPSTPAQVRHSAAVLWTGGTAYRLTDPVSHRSARLDVASFGGRTRLQLTTPSLVIWLGGIETSATPTFVCIQAPPAAPSCNPPKPTRTTAQQAILEATRPLIEYSQADRAEGAVGRARAGHERGRLPRRLPAGALDGGVRDGAAVHDAGTGS